VKRVIGIVTACAVASFVPVATNAATTSPKPATHASATVSLAASREAAHLAELRNLAPADEYFGRLKLSILGIKNTLKDLGLRYSVNHDIAVQTVTSANEAEGAIRDWEHKYPRDKDVPRQVYFLQRFYSSISCDQGRAKAHSVAMWLFADYPKSVQARLLHKQLAQEALAPPPVAAPAASAGTAGAPPVAVPAAQSGSGYQSIFGNAYPTEFNH
jgi:hypothetical protein